MARDKDGNYVNEKGVVIKATEDKNGKTHIDFYDGSPRDPHSGVHVTVKPDSKDYSAGSHNSDKSEKDHHEGSCYLTSACMRHLQEEFDDDCHELFILRWFRDTFVTKSEINYYYEIAPRIVEQIEQADNREEIYEYIYTNIIMPCVKAIEFGDFKSAYTRYKSSILCLEEEFVCKANGHVKTLLPNI